MSLYDGVHALPLFNPDLEADMPAVVQALRDALMRSGAVIIASPEYAHGLSGGMQNALDWRVSDERFVGAHDRRCLSCSTGAGHGAG